MKSGTRILTSLILFYQRAVSPWLGANCRFDPTCSEWARQAIEAHGILKGSAHALRRLLSCHPFHPGGYDPVRPVHG